MATDRRLPAILWGGTAIFVIAVLLAATTLLRTQRAEALANSEARISRFISGAEAAINRSFLGIDLLLAGLAEPLAEIADPADGASVARLNRLLGQVTRQNLQLREVALLGADGRVLAAGDVF